MKKLLVALGVLVAQAAFAHGTHGSDTNEWPAGLRNYGGEPSRAAAKNVDVKTAWETTFAGEFASHPWLASFGKQRLSELTSFNSRMYVLYEGCKPEDCEGERYLMLFDPNSGKAYGAFRTDAQSETKIHWLGQPDEPIQTYMASHLFEFAEAH
ncbi:inhibitor of vertebrate lysozyme family protein [Leeia sp. TBRC 13508]|uniref:Inhibitor of vertebrate lysozyme family protein n=1 Tax=Leeia speluncae TaxID=2884804 RepID=A0ABS8D6K0_9NEIS|nr:Ivy family c-type lysozyme inhibitor [Leeia speluncae]MCB6183801.1 inhibitor of vertebrate lysozyme family protein [Leeia speluncae]